VDLDFSSDGKWVVTADHYCSVTLWSRDAEKPLWSVHVTNEVDPSSPDGWQYSALAVKFADDGKRILVVWKAGVAQLDREKGTTLKITKFPKPVYTVYHSGGYAVAFLPGSDECVYYGTDERLVRFNFTTNKRHDKFDISIPNFAGVDVTVSPDGKRLLGWTRWGLNEWDLTTGEICQRFAPMKYSFSRIAYTPDGDRIWVPQKMFALLDRRTGKELKLPEALANYKGYAWLSPDGKHAIGLPRGEREDDRVDVLRLADGKVLRSFSSEGLFYRPVPWGNGENKHLYSQPGWVMFTPDGKTALLSGSGDRTELGFWDVETGKHIRTIRDKWWREP
jgi:hypothetical protein